MAARKLAGEKSPAGCPPLKEAELRKPRPKKTAKAAPKVEAPPTYLTGVFLDRNKYGQGTWKAILRRGDLIAYLPIQDMNEDNTKEEAQEQARRVAWQW